MKSTEKSQTSENPWAEGMKGSHDASWLGRLWQGCAGALVAAIQVTTAHDKLVREQKAEEEPCNDPFSQENIHNPLFHGRSK